MDDGIGMEPETLDHVFERFSRAPEQGGQGKAGLGLGLALVKALVEMHGGRVEASSQGLGRGSTFIVALPKLANLPEPGASLENKTSVRVE